MSNHLDLGCGTTPHNPYGKKNIFGVDIRDDLQAILAPKGVIAQKANLILEKIPFGDNHFSSVSAIDFLEHIPRQICLGSSNEIIYPFIGLMNEVWRVLAPGGRFLAITPAFPSPQAFSDPTHVNYITRSTHEYFCGETPAGSIYGFHGRFNVRIAKMSVATNFRKMPHNPLTTALRDMGRHISGKGVHHMIWELEAVK